MTVLFSYGTVLGLDVWPKAYSIGKRVDKAEAFILMDETRHGRRQPRDSTASPGDTNSTMLTPGSSNQAGVGHGHVICG